MANKKYKITLAAPAFHHPVSSVRPDSKVCDNQTLTNSTEFNSEHLKHLKHQQKKQEFRLKMCHLITHTFSNWLISYANKHLSSRKAFAVFWLVDNLFYVTPFKSDEYTVRFSIIAKYNSLDCSVTIIHFQALFFHIYILVAHQI